MGVVFHEILGEVSPERPTERAETPAPPAPPHEEMEPIELRRALARLHQREVRRRAD